MKKITISFIVLILVVGCSKNSDNTVATENNTLLPIKSAGINTFAPIKLAKYDTINASNYLIYKPLTEQEKDSISQQNIALHATSVSCQNLNFYNSEYTDYSGKIHLKFFYQTTPQPANLSTLTVAVDAGWVLVGGGAWGHDYNGNGAWLVKSYPMDDGNTWYGESKAHIIQDPHCLTVFAIGMKIDEVDPAYLKSNRFIRKVSTTNPVDFPTATAILPPGYLLVGGGASIRYNGYGNMLVASYPTNLSSWYASGKSYRRSDASLIDVYAIGLNNINYSSNGGSLYLQVTFRQTFESAPSNQEGLCDAPVWEGYALTCPGGYTQYPYYGRMLVSLSSATYSCKCQCKR